MATVSRRLGGEIVIRCRVRPAAAMHAPQRPSLRTTHGATCSARAPTDRSSMVNDEVMLLMSGNGAMPHHKQASHFSYLTLHLGVYTLR